MKFTKSLRETLIDEVVEVKCRYVHQYMSFNPDNPPKVKIETQGLGPWLWIKSQADYEGTTSDPSTDRSGGDPYSAHVFHHWIGKVKSAPSAVSHLEELSRWALIHTKYERQYTDVGSWGTHTGYWVDSITSDGMVTLLVQSSRTFHDVSPESETTTERIDLNLFRDSSFEALVQLLGDKKTIIHVMAINQLGDLGDNRAVKPIFIQATEDDSETVWERAIVALGKLGGDEAIERLISILIEKENHRSWASHSLVMIGEPALDSLFPLIGNENEHVSITVVEIIDDIGEARSFEILFQVLENERPSVQARIIRALGGLGNKQAYDTLIEKLQDQNPEVQGAAAQALGRLHDKRAVVPLVAALLASDKNVRTEVAEALSQLDWQPSNPEETAWDFFARCKWKELIAMRKSAKDLIIRALQDSDHYLRYTFLKALTNADITLNDARAIEPILGIYNYPDEDQEDNWKRRKNAIKALGRIKILQVVRPLIQIYLHEKESTLRTCAFDSISLLTISGVDVADTLVSILTEKKVRKFKEDELQAYLKLFTVAPASREQIKTITPMLESVVKRKTDEDTIKIASGLLRLDGLFTELSDGPRKKAAESLGEIGLPSATIPLINALEDVGPAVWQTVVEALGRLGQGSLLHILPAFGSKVHNVRIGIAEALGRLGDSKAAKKLMKALKDPHRSVRQNSAWALGRLSSYWWPVLEGEIILALTKTMTKDEYLPVRFNAVYSLASIGDERVVPPLLKALVDPEVEVRFNAAYGLMKQASKLKDNRTLVIDKLILAMSDESERVRYNVVDALRLFGGTKAMEALIAAQEDKDPDTRKLANRGVKELESIRRMRTTLPKFTRRSYKYNGRGRYELGGPDAM
ncbi:MAG: HEAT repeat domain-containing protein [Candidatus Thorarchaeota archaeon]